MLTNNPFAELALVFSAVALQYFVIVMILLVIVSTALDMLHKKNVVYFFRNAKTAKRAAKIQLTTIKKTAVILKTVAHDIATTSELGMGKRRLAHVLGMYGTILFWIASVILIFKTSELLFPKSKKVQFLSITFFFFPTVLLTSTQMLRDPIFMLGFCILCYSFVEILKQNKTETQKFRLVFFIQIGLILIISMRDYLSPIFLIGLLIFAVIALLQKRMSTFQLILLVLPLIAFENLTTNTYSTGPDKHSLKAQNEIIKQVKNVETTVNLKKAKQIILRYEAQLKAQSEAQNETVTQEAQKETVTQEAQKETVTQEAQKDTVTQEAQKETVTQEAQKETVTQDAQKETVTQEAQNEPKSDQNKELTRLLLEQKNDPDINIDINDYSEAKLLLAEAMENEKAQIENDRIN